MTIKIADYINDKFSLTIKHDFKQTIMVMDIYDSVVNTKHLPYTHSILKKELPSILFSKCFNDNKYSFNKEVKKTEIGHLFEHILLEYLCLIKRSYGIDNPIHNGVTEWNWQKDNHGVFHISVDSGIDNEEIFSKAIKLTIRLINKILDSSNKIRSKSINVSINYLNRQLPQPSV